MNFSLKYSDLPTPPHRCQAHHAEAVLAICVRAHAPNLRLAEWEDFAIFDALLPQLPEITPKDSRPYIGKILDAAHSDGSFMYL